MFKGNLLEDKEIRIDNRRCVPNVFPRSGSCGGVRGGLINTCQSKMLRNEEEDHGPGGVALEAR